MSYPQPLTISAQLRKGFRSLTDLQKAFLFAMAVPLLSCPSFIRPFGQFLGILVYASVISASGWGIGTVAVNLPRRCPRPAPGAHYQRRVVAYNAFTSSVALLLGFAGAFLLAGLLARLVLGDWKLLIVGGVPMLVVSFGFAAYTRYRYG